MFGSRPRETSPRKRRADAATDLEPLLEDLRRLPPAVEAEDAQRPRRALVCLRGLRAAVLRAAARAVVLRGWSWLRSLL